MIAGPGRRTIGIGLLASLLLIFSAGRGQPEQSAVLQPYLLVGESGQSVERTAKTLIGRLFMQDFEILAKYHPANDQDRYILVISHARLRRAVQSGGRAAALALVMRIAIHARGEMTYISIQEPRYWGNAFLQDDYPAAAEHIENFRRKLLAVMPKLRGRFNRSYGGHYTKPLTADDLRTYSYKRRSEGLADLAPLAVFDSFDEAVAAVEEKLGAAPGYNLVFKVQVPGREQMLFGVAISAEPGDSALLALPVPDDPDLTASLPLELLLADNTVYMLPIRYRAPLAAPGDPKADIPPPQVATGRLYRESDGRPSFAVNVRPEYCLAVAHTDATASVSY